MAWSKEYRSAYMRKWRADHPNYDKTWYAENKERVNKNIRKKYMDDEAFREYTLKRNRKYHQEKKLKK